MSRAENTINRVAEFSKKVDIATAVIALGGATLGLIPVGVASAVIAFSIATYYGADYVNRRFGIDKKGYRNSSGVVYLAPSVPA